MSRQIQSINVSGRTIYINFVGGVFGTRTQAADGKWINKNLKDNELTEARRLACKDGRWTKWQAPRQTQSAKFARQAEDDLDTPLTNEEIARLNRNQPGESEIYG